MATRKTGSTGGAKKSSEDKERRRSDRQQRREARMTRRAARADMKAAKVRRYDAKTEARKKAGGAGMSIVFYEIAMPDKSKCKVGRKDGGARSGR